MELIGESEVKEGSFRPTKGLRQWIKDAAGMRLAERAAFSREYGCTSSAINLPDDLPRLMSTGVFRAQNPPIVPQLVEGKRYFPRRLFSTSRYAIKKKFLRWANRFTDRFRSVRGVVYVLLVPFLNAAPQWPRWFVTESLPSPRVN